MNKKGLFGWVIIVLFALFMITLGLIAYMSYTESDKVCKEFGGNLASASICVKDGVGYDVIFKSEWSFSLERQVISRAMSLGDANLGADE